MNLKKSLVKVLLSLFICSSLWGCGKSNAVKNVEELIDGIGEVTADSEESIEEAEKAFNALSDKEKEQVENAAQLEQKKEEVKERIKEAEEEAKKEEEKKKLAEKKEKLAPYDGTWKPIYSEAVNNDLLHSSPKVKKIYSKDLNIDELDETITPIDETTIKVSRDGLGALKLVDDQGITKFVSEGGAFVRKSEYDDVMDKMFVHVILDEDNIGDYIGGPIKIGRYLDEWGDETDADAYVLSSPAYDNEGLILLSFKDVKFEVYYNGVTDSTTYYEPYPLGYALGTGTPTLNKFGRAEGEIWYVRKEYVSNISE